MANEYPERSECDFSTPHMYRQLDAKRAQALKKEEATQEGITQEIEDVANRIDAAMDIILTKTDK